jgi:hypothetical protein
MVGCIMENGNMAYNMAKVYKLVQTVKKKLVFGIEATFNNGFEKILIDQGRPPLYNNMTDY